MPTFLQGYSEAATSVSSSSNILTIDYTAALSNYFYTALTESVTSFTVSNLPVGEAVTITLEITQTDNYQITDWPGNVNWITGVTPTLPDGNGIVSILTLTTRDQGANWIGGFITDPAEQVVNTVHGRIGNVVAVSGDYNSSQITNTSSVTGATVSDVVNNLDSNKADSGHTHLEADITDLDKYTKAETDGLIGGRATSAQGSLADSAVQPNDNISTLNNDAGFITSAPVNSVAGKTGIVTLTLSDITDFDSDNYATGAEGDLAATALQSGANVSELVNDQNYLTSSDTVDGGQF